MTKIQKCVCKSNLFGSTNGANYQDKKYGEGFRVYNKTADVTPKFRCTICGREVGGDKK